MDGTNEVIEALADYAHEAWSGWMAYLFEKSHHNPDGTVTIPQWAVERWKRQLRTIYKDLSEAEKESDREEARKMVDILTEVQGRIVAARALERVESGANVRIADEAAV